MAFGRYVEKMDEALADWSAIAGWGRWNLLLGNGFSQNISPKFGYGTLFEVACARSTNPCLNGDGRALFDELDSTHFEEVLQHLGSAARVAGTYGENAFRTRLLAAQENVREALIGAIHAVHIEPQKLREKKCDLSVRKYLDSCGEIFTTNYDLIPYWAIMAEKGGKGFADFFWGDGGQFAGIEAEVFGYTTPIYYLHGALHLFRDDTGSTTKLACDDSNLILDQVDAGIRAGKIPLVITEGSSAYKLRAINSSDYLSFAFRAFKSSNMRLAVFGHSLSNAFDGHLIKAMNEDNWERRTIAIGVHPTFVTDIIAFKHGMKAMLPKTNLKFFDSTTHPLDRGNLER
ncbi:MAG: DUF4917 family protein [Bdellovibrionales bacterium]|nr:DUF4917 family protein [Bdellovibrionales bacterium]